MSSIVNFILSVGPTFAFVGTYLLILSHQKQNEIKHTIQKGMSTEGTVIDIVENPEKSYKSKLPQGYAPKVEFTTSNGTYLHQSSTYMSPGRYYIGQKVKIYYYFYKSRREMALEDDEPGTLPKSLLKWGIIFCIIGYPILLIKMNGLF